MLTVVLVVSTALAILLSMACSLWESTLLSLSSVRLEALQRQGRAYARVWLRLKNNIDRPIAAILIINTIANTGGAALAGSVFAQLYGNEWLGVFMAGLTLAILYLSEIGPKIIGATYCEQLAPFLGKPLAVATRVLTPLIALTEAYARLLRGCGGPAAQETLTPVDLEVMAQLLRTRNVIASQQEQIIINAAKLHQVRLAEVMIPREWIVFFRTDLSADENFSVAQHSMHTRLPVSFNASVDNITGYINYKDLIGLRSRAAELNLTAFIRPISTLHPRMDLNRALKHLIARRNHIALVKDEDDRVQGMVTLEDLMEELVGEIEDEFDTSAHAVIPVTDDLWRVGAALAIEKIAAIVGADFPADEPGQTLGDWLQRRLGDVRYPGASHWEGGIHLTVQQARRGKIYMVMIEKHRGGGVASDRRAA